MPTHAIEMIPQILFVLAHNIAIHVLLLHIQYSLMGIKTTMKKTFLCAACISLLHLIPLYSGIFIVEFHGGANALRPVIYNLTIFITPPAAIASYFAVKSILKFSPTRSSIVLHIQLLMHYIVVLTYMVLVETFSTLLGSTLVTKNLYASEVLSIFPIITILLITLFTVKSLLKKNRKYIIIPPNYAEKNIGKHVLKIFLSMCCLYAVAVIYRMYWLIGVWKSITMNTAFFYALLIGEMLFYLFNTITRLQMKLKDWEMQAADAYISSLVSANQEFQGIKHDFYNMLQVYGGYLSLGNYEALKEYHQSLFNATQLAGDFLELIEVLRPRMAVYSLFKAKAHKAEMSGVRFSINLICDITDVVLTDIDLCRVLSIVFDNAIEAAASSEKKQVHISFERRNDKTVLFIISNTTEGDVDVDSMFIDGYTTKAGHTGIGIPQVMHILNSHEYCTLRVSYHENLFTLFLIVYADESAKASL